MLKKFQRHLNTNFPQLKDKKLLLAVSGGIDSMVLMHLFQQLHYDISIAHCNFQLRGNESDGDEMLVKEICQDGRTGRKTVCRAQLAARLCYQCGPA